MVNTFINTQNKMPKNFFSNITTIIKDAKKGRMFILVDDKDRENEGDLIIPGSKCNSQSINFMAKHGRGLICLALTKQQIENATYKDVKLLEKFISDNSFSKNQFISPLVSLTTRPN